MAGHVCPPWLAVFLANPFRKLLQDPQAITAPYLEPGQTALDIGCGPGFFSVAMAELVGREGRVIAVDLQPKMLDMLQRRARRAGVDGIIEPRRCRKDDIGVKEPVDFVLAFAVVHEVEDQRRLFSQLAACLKPESRLLVAEPRAHINQAAFEESISLAHQAGLAVIERPKIRLSRSALLHLL